jgi:acetyl esterase
MTDRIPDRIPLEQVAADQRPSVRAFREAGEVSYEDAASVEALRVSSAELSAAGALPPDDIAAVEDVDLREFTVRIYDPRGGSSDSSGTGPSPVILYAHGGGWVIGSVDTHDSVARRLCSGTGLPVVSVDYRLAPEHPFPVPYTDCADALAWVRDVASDRHWDPDRVVVSGDSAGGGIAAGLASVPAAQVPGTTVVAQVLLYPSVDLEHETEAYERVTAGFQLTAASVRWFADQLFSRPAHPSDADDPRASPLAWLRGQEDAGTAVEQPPAFILALGLDPLGTEAVDYAAALTRCGTAVELHYLPHHAHGLVNAAGKVPTGEKVLGLTTAFITRTLAVPDGM